jgi:hypothetical protein
MYLFNFRLLVATFGHDRPHRVQAAVWSILFWYTALGTFRFQDPAHAASAMAGKLLLLWSMLVVVCSLHAKNAYGWNITHDLAGLIEDHLVAPAGSLKDSSSTWQQQFRIHRELHGAGFHRTLTVSVQHKYDDTAHLHGCQTSLLQPLPSSIYADPYQLEDLLRSRSSNKDTVTSTAAGRRPFNFQLLGLLDLEL